MKNLLFVWICLFFLLNTAKLSATHLVSADGHITCLKINPDNNEYAIQINGLRDAGASTVPFDMSIDIGIYGRSDGSLKLIIEVPQVKESIAHRSVTGQGFYIEALYESTFQLPEIAGGYVLQLRRCCLPSTQTLIDNMGLELLIYIPEGMQSGQHTLKRNKGFEPILKKNQNNTFSYPWTNNLYDSIRYESKDYYTGGSESDPMPGFPPSINYGDKALFRNGFAAGNPFGNGGTWTKLSDSTYEIKITQSGYFVYPISTTCYLNGDSFMQTVLFPVISVDTVLPQLWLDYVSNDGEAVLLSSTSKNWSSVDSISLQRRIPQMPAGTFTSILFQVIDGIAIPLYDSSVQPGTNYTYRIKLVSNGKIYYSNEILARTFAVGLSEISISEQFIQVYPNPANKELNIQSPVSLPYHLYSINGQLKLEGTLEEGNNFLQIDQLPEGIYFLKTEFETLKIVIDDRR